MLKTLIRQELLVNLMDARFSVTLIITLLLVFANTVVFLDAYERRIATHRLQETIHQERIVEEGVTYSMLDLRVERPPNPLSLFSAGLDTRLGTTISIDIGHVPLFLDLSGHNTPNPFLNLFSQLDLVTIFQVVLSLIALLFAYNAIAGDLETGTLRLVTSHPISRGLILFAKYIASIVCLLIPLLMSMLLVLLLLSVTRSIQLTSVLLLRIGGIGLTTCLYLSVFYTIGLLISTVTRRTATALMLCMTIWVLLVLVYPNWTRFAIFPVGDLEARVTALKQQREQLWEEMERAERKFLDNSQLTGKKPFFNLKMAGASSASSASAGRRLRVALSLAESAETQVPFLQDYHQFMVTAHIRFAQKVQLAREQQVVNARIHQARWDEQIMKLSPASRYTFTTAVWAGTDLNSILEFINATQQYRQMLINYFHDKDAFGSPLWFAYDHGSLDWSSLPRFIFDPTAVSINASRVFADMFVIFFINLVLFVITFLIFIKIEV